MGDDNCLRSMVGEIISSLKGINYIEVVGLNMEEDKEAAFDGAVDMAWKLLGTVDAFVNCYVYEGRAHIHNINIETTSFMNLFYISVRHSYI